MYFSSTSFKYAFFSRHFSYLRVKYGFPHKQERKVQPKNKKKTKTVKPTNQNATLLWLDPILCAKNLCKEGASAQIELLLLYTTTSQYLCQTAVPPIQKPLNLEECKQPQPSQIQNSSISRQAILETQFLIGQIWKICWIQLAFPNSKKCQTVSPIHKPLNLEE